MKRNTLSRAGGRPAEYQNNAMPSQRTELPYIPGSKQVVDSNASTLPMKRNTLSRCGREVDRKDGSFGLPSIQSCTTPSHRQTIGDFGAAMSNNRYAGAYAPSPLLPSTGQLQGRMMGTGNPMDMGGMRHSESCDASMFSHRMGQQPGRQGVLEGRMMSVHGSVDSGRLR